MNSNAEKNAVSNKGHLKPLSPVYYFCGAEDFLVEEAVNKIKDAALTKGMESMNLNVFDRANFSAEGVLTAANTMPAFSDKRVVVVKDAEKIKAKEIDALCDYVKKPSPQTCLIFIAEGTRIGKGEGAIKPTDLTALLSEKGFVKQFGCLSDDAALAWIKKEATKQGRAITDGGARLLHLMSGGRLRAIKNELEKITLFTVGKDEIDEKAVKDAGLDCREETVFGLSDAIGAKDLSKALHAYNRISNEEPFAVMGAIARQIRILLKIKLMMKKGVSRGALTRELNIYPAHFEGYMRRERLFTIDELKTALTRLREVDVALKTGRMAPSLAVPELIMDLCG